MSSVTTASSVQDSASVTAANTASKPTTDGPATPLSGAVQAQLPVRSYANATKTASSTPSHNANGPGAMATHAAAEPAMNGVPNGVASDHARKPSVVISASGATGYTSNGAPVGQNDRPSITFGSVPLGASPSQQPSMPYQSQSSSSNLHTPSDNPRVISPAHSPSPIPQPAASGGRPPSNLQSQGNGPIFGSHGSVGGDASGQSQTAHGAIAPSGPNADSNHTRRASSQSTHTSDSNMNRNYGPSANGRGGRGNFQPNYMGSPAQNYRQLSNQGRPPSMNPQYPQGPMPQNPQFSRPPGRQQSPAIPPSQPQMQHMPYGGYQHPQQVYFDPYNGHYQPYPYGYGQYPPAGPSQSPRPQYPNPYAGTPGQSQPPFMPPSMARTPSQASDRPGSSIGHAGTPGQSHAIPSSQGQAAGQQAPPAAANNFVRPTKKSSAIKITNEKGEAVTFGKPTQQTTAPVIVSTPSTSTPPPRVPSAQHNRTESKSTMSKDETQKTFKEQVKRQLEEEKRRQEGGTATSTAIEDKETLPKAEIKETPAKSEDKDTPAKAEDKQTPAKPASEAAPVDSVTSSTTLKEATADVEKAAAVAAGDEQGAKSAETAKEAVGETDEERKKREEQEEEERFEREIAEMEAKEREEEEREKAFQEKRRREKEEAAKNSANSAAKADEELKKQEREAEEREAERERERDAEKTKEEPDDESKALFASLKRPTLGPGASASDAGTPTEEQPTDSNNADSTSAEDAAAPTASATGRPAGAQKPKPAQLKLETSKRVEPAEPTPGMQALKSARFLELREELAYPEGIKSPNPALNAGGTKKARAYDKDFLLQFQSVFKEKPSVDWDQKVRDTLGAGDEPGSARTQSARTPSGAAGRSASARGPQPAPSFGGPMGAFGNVPQGRTLPPGTTSQDRFMASSSSGGRGMGMPPPMGRMPSNLGMGGPGMAMNRNASVQGMGPGSPRQPSSRGGKGASKRDNRQPSRKEEADMAAKMPLTAGAEVKALEKSQSGWKASSITQGPMANAPSLDGHMAPDLVQRKVKAALNKMTPEKFDKISDQILEIAGQSKNETDGRTLRQVIQLTFEKACDESHWAGMYAKFCHKMLTAMSTEIRDETIKDKAGNPVVGGALFRKYLLTRCQEEFERGWQANLPDKPEGETEQAALLSDEYYVAAAAKRKGLGLIQFIGQLYKLGMLTGRIMHECVMRLLNFEGDPDEAAVENLTTLLKSVGATMDDGEHGHALVDTYFQRIKEKIMENPTLPSRPKFMIMDLMDLRRVGWKGKDDAKGPKTITQIREEADMAHAKAEAERQRNRTGGPGRPPAGRGDSRNFSNQPPPPVDFQRTNVSGDDLRKLQNRPTRIAGGTLGPGGNLGPSGLGARAGSRRGGNLGPPGSGNSTRTSTPPVGEKDKKDDTAQQNAFSALADLAHEDTESAAAAGDRSKSPLPAGAAEEA